MKLNLTAQIKLSSSCMLCAFMLTLPLSVHAKDSDPYESFNRSIWSFNETFDRLIFKPLAKGYKKITPDIVESGISNFYTNLTMVPTAFNHLLQGRPGRAGQDVTRFVFNLTFGGLGFYDFSSDIGLPLAVEDFGQTLGVWGVPSGPYLVLPFLGPSSFRDAPSLIVDYQTDLSDAYGSNDDQNAITGMNIIQIRANLLALDDLAPGDKYLFFRDAYLQRREGQIRNGKSEKEDAFLEGDFF